MARWWCWLFVSALFASRVVGVVHQHDCISQEISNSMPVPSRVPVTESRRRRLAGDPMNLNVVLHEDEISSCGAKDEPFVTGLNLVQCPLQYYRRDCFGICSAGDVLTQKKRVTLDTIMSEVVDTIASHLGPIRKPESIELGATSTCVTTMNLEPQTYTDTDFVIFVTVEPTWAGVAAWAVPCAYDDVTGRPVAGQINFGPTTIPEDPTDEELDYLSTIALHECFHALGMERTTTQLFWDNELGIPHSGEVLRTVSQDEGRVGEKVLEILVTPNVKEWVRNHFECDDEAVVVGAELEDYAGTQGFHWEKRLFADELMTGTQTGSLQPVLSGLTLAFFKDSGWYDVISTNTDVSSLSWGKSAGCGMLAQPCPTTQGYHCTLSENGHKRCSPGSSNLKAVCSFGSYSGLEAKYQYGISPSDPSLAGSDAFLDYCPLYIPRNVDTDVCSSTNPCETTENEQLLSCVPGSVGYQSCMDSAVTQKSQCDSQVSYLVEEFDALFSLCSEISSLSTSACRFYQCHDEQLYVSTGSDFVRCAPGTTIESSGFSMTCPSESIEISLCHGVFNKIGMQDFTSEPSNSGGGTTTTPSASPSGDGGNLDGEEAEPVEILSFMDFLDEVVVVSSGVKVAIFVSAVVITIGCCIVCFCCRNSAALSQRRTNKKLFVNYLKSCQFAPKRPWSTDDSREYKHHVKVWRAMSQQERNMFVNEPPSILSSIGATSPGHHRPQLPHSVSGVDFTMAPTPVPPHAMHYPPPSHPQAGSSNPTNNSLLIPPMVDPTTGTHCGSGKVGGGGGGGAKRPSARVAITSVAKVARVRANGEKRKEEYKRFCALNLDIKMELAAEGCEVRNVTARDLFHSLKQMRPPVPEDQWEYFIRDQLVVDEAEGSQSDHQDDEEDRRDAFIRQFEVAKKKLSSSSRTRDVTADDLYEDVISEGIPEKNWEAYIRAHLLQ